MKQLKSLAVVVDSLSLQGVGSCEVPDAGGDDTLKTGRSGDSDASPSWSDASKKMYFQFSGTLEFIYDSAGVNSEHMMKSGYRRP